MEAGSETQDEINNIINEYEEIIVVENGHWVKPDIQVHDKVKIVHLGEKVDNPIEVGQRLVDNEKVSIIIPTRNELYLNNTINNILERAGGDVEVVAVLDGPPREEPPIDERVIYIRNEKPIGMRQSINMGVEKSTGKYIMKCDGHCAFDKDFDLKLKKDCKPNWVVVPRRYSVDKEKWDKTNDFKDFQYISHPNDTKYPFKGCDWIEYGARVKGQRICDLMTSQGSCWFMHKSWFEKIGGLDTVNYGSMGAEAQEVCLKTWLGGGRYILNRNTWYAHKKKRNDIYYRGYNKPTEDWKKSRAYAIECWTNNKWEGQVKSLEWLINKFKPVPGWHTSMENLEVNRFIKDKYNLQYGVNDNIIKIGGINRKDLTKLWAELGYKTGCEVGVAAGYFSNVMFENIPDLKMYLVEPYFDYSGGKKYRDLHDKYQKQASDIFSDKNAEWIIELSENAFNKIPDRSLDFVYIDGNHKYNYVMLDLILWNRKVRKGGMVAGHDYESKGKRHVGGVYHAVNDYVKRNNIEPLYMTDNNKIEHRSDRHASFFWVV